MWNQIPKHQLAIIVIIVGIILMLLMDPPHSVCNSQLETFKANQKSFIYLDPKNKIKKTTEFERFLNQCKISNSPGGCYELFAQLKSFLFDLDSIPKKCKSEVSSDTQIRNTIWESLALMTQLAWGEKPPDTYFKKFGWLEGADLVTFCNLKRAGQKYFSEQKWKDFQNEQVKKLPGADTLETKRIWEMALYSTNCDQYQ